MRFNRRFRKIVDVFAMQLLFAGWGGALAAADLPALTTPSGDSLVAAVNATLPTDAANVCTFSASTVASIPTGQFGSCVLAFATKNQYDPSKICTSDVMLIVHIAIWNVTVNSTPESLGLTSSSWSVYALSWDSTNKICSLKASSNGPADQLPKIYNAHRALLIGISEFTDSASQYSVAPFTVQYKVSNTPQTAQNKQNLIALVSGLAGIASSGGGGAPSAASTTFTPSSGATYVGVGWIPGSKKLPFDFSAAYTVTPPPAPGNSAPAPTGGARANSTLPAASPGAQPLIMPAGHLNVPYSEFVPVGGGSGISTFSAPSVNGLSVTSDGRITGTPGTTGPSTFQVLVKNSLQADATEFPIQIQVNAGPADPLTETGSADSPNPQIYTAQLPEAHVGLEYSAFIPIQGGTGNKTFSPHPGSVPPPGLAMTPDGWIRGIPTQKTNGASLFVNVTDSASGASAKLFSFQIAIDGAAAQALAPAQELSGGGKGKPPAATQAAATTPTGNQNPGTQTAATTQSSSTPSQGQQNAPADCSTLTTASQSPCTVTRTFLAEDREWWDVGLIVPSGVHSGSALEMSVYGMVDINALAKYGDEDSFAPHFSVGIPISGQPLHLPYFAVADSFGGLTERIGLPRVSFTYGFVRVQEPTHTVWRYMFGAEVSVGSLASALKSVVK